VIAAKGAGHSIIGDPRPVVTQYVAQHTISEGTYPSLAVLVKAFVFYSSAYEYPAASVISLTPPTCSRPA
jgi:hypothetical protein